MVPFIDLKAQYATIKSEIDSAVSRVIESCQFALGPEVELFENAFADYCQTKYAIGVNSGTSALHLALLAAGVGPNDEVITVPFTFVAAVAAILYTGARPVFVDIEPRFFTIDVDQIEQAITSRTKAIVPVHLYGQPADMDRILEIARRHRLIVIEDAAQAHGAVYKGRRVGSIGDVGCFSFYPTKNLAAYGEGGALTTNNEAWAQQLRALRDWGQKGKYSHTLKGYNYRLESIQAAVLRVKLRHLEAWTEARRSHARHYNELLSHSEVQTPQSVEHARHVYHIYAIRTKHRDALQRSLQEDGVETAIHYPVPVYLQQAYSDLGIVPGSFPCAEAVAETVLSLPIFPELTETQLRHVASSIGRGLRGMAASKGMHST
jgi:dTDP-4-amino-4,6-dideoxygalactose transaminase